MTCYELYWLIGVPVVVFGAIIWLSGRHPRPKNFHPQRDRHDDTH